MKANEKSVAFFFCAYIIQ